MPHRTSSPSRTTKSKAERAKKYLSVGGVAREDSDDELGLEDHPWEWIYSIEPAKRRASSSSGDEREIVGARMGGFQCMVGDSVLLKAEGTREAWIGLICAFVEDGEDDEGGEKAADFMWFSTEREVWNKQKKRTDALPVCFWGFRSGWCFFLRAKGNELLVRSLHYAFLGREPVDVDQREGIDRLGRDVQIQVPVRQGPAIIERLRQDIRLPERLQYADGDLHRRVRMGGYIQFCRRYTAVDRAR